MPESERKSCTLCGHPPGGHMSSCPTRDDVISEMRDLVWAETGRALADGDFSTVGAEPSVPAELLRPVIARGDGMGGTAIAVREIPTMGKAAFVEQPVVVDGVAYRFVQWKGVGTNIANDRMDAESKSRGAAFLLPLGESGMAPLFFMEQKGDPEKGETDLRILRFKGGAFYEDLLTEARKSEEFAGYGLRTPKILATVKFTRAFCERNDLPLPDNDGPENAGGQTLRAYLESHRSQIEPDALERILTAHELFAGYGSAILGENVRAFRNVWRVDDIERVMEEPESPERTEKLAAIVDASVRILSEELGRKLSREEFLREFIVLLGTQTSTLVENRLNQGALTDIKQDVTLAAEICDLDNAYCADDPANIPNWVKDDVTRAEWMADEETRSKWEREQHVRVDRQILLLAAHVKPLADAIGELRGRPLDGAEVVDAFLDVVRQGLSEQTHRDVVRRVSETPNFGSVDAIVTSTTARKNLGGSQEWFNWIVDAIRKWENLSSE